MSNQTFTVLEGIDACISMADRALRELQAVCIAIGDGVDIDVVLDTRELNPGNTVQSKLAALNSKISLLSNMLTALAATIGSANTSQKSEAKCQCPPTS